MYGCKIVAIPLVMNDKLKKDGGAQKANASIYI